MKARPILFSAPMIQALLKGQKTQTRRIIKLDNNSYYSKGQVSINVLMEQNTVAEDFCPYGKIGDLLWVRENFSYHRPYVSDYLPIDRGQEIANADIGVHCWADGNPEYGDWGRIRPSIHMPRWASRLTLEIGNIRIEKLQSISESDALAEGCKGYIYHGLPRSPNPAYSNQDIFYLLWKSINGLESWEKNPYVWVIEFKVHKSNVDTFFRRADAGKKEI